MLLLLIHSLAYTPSWQAYTTLLILLAAVALQLWQQPYELPLHNFFEALGLLASLMLQVSGLVLQEEDAAVSTVEVITGLVLGVTCLLLLYGSAQPIVFSAVRVLVRHCRWLRCRRLNDCRLGQGRWRYLDIANWPGARPSAAAKAQSLSERHLKDRRNRVITAARQTSEEGVEVPTATVPVQRPQESRIASFAAAHSLMQQLRTRRHPRPLLQNAGFTDTKEPAGVIRHAATPPSVVMSHAD